MHNLEVTDGLKVSQWIIFQGNYTQIAIGLLRSCGFINVTVAEMPFFYRFDHFFPYAAMLKHDRYDKKTASLDCSFFSKFYLILILKDLTLTFHKSKHT
jgi:hypothetical protein